MRYIFLFLQVIGSLIYLVIVTIIMPRASRNDTRRNIFQRNIFPHQPIVYILGFYFYSTLTLIYIHNLSSSLTIIINLLLLAFGKIIGLKLRLIGMTGQICGGKTLASQYLRERYNASIITSEEINQILRKKKNIFIEEIRKNMFKELIDIDLNNMDQFQFNQCVINNQKFSNFVEKKIRLDLYWYLLKRIVMDKLYYKKQFVFLEFDLLLKFNSFSMICFPIVSIYNTEKEVVINRMRRKYGFGDDKVYEIYSNQITLEEFNLKSDKVIYNEGTINTFERKLDKFMLNIFV